MMNFNIRLVMLVSLILITLLGLTGCFPKPEIREVLVYKTKEVYIPVPCDTEVSCDFKGSGFKPTERLYQCVVAQKRALEYCKQTQED